MYFQKCGVVGSLQTKVMILLREKHLCGIDLKKELSISSPGTIYPLLRSLRRKGLIEYDIERTNAARKKVYHLTQKGKVELARTLQSWTKLTCCDWSFYIRRFTDILNGFIKIKENEKILCTLDAELSKDWLKNADTTFCYELDEMPKNYFDKVISLIGVGTVIGKESKDSIEYLSSLKESLKENGTLIALEIEKTDNLWAERYFIEISGFKEHPGLKSEELGEQLKDLGMKDIQIFSGGGILVSISSK